MSRYASKLTVKGSTGGTGQAAQAGDEAEGPSQEHVPDSSIPLLGCVLQAPVSDREVGITREMCEGSGLVGSGLIGVYLICRRLCLAERWGAGPDLGQLVAPKLGHMPPPIP